MVRRPTAFAQIIIAFVAVNLAIAGAAPARADGVVIPRPPPDVVVPPFLGVKQHHVTVTIDRGVATTHVDQIFVNDASVDLEGTYIFPLPEDAAISDFAMWADGKRLEGKILDRDEARSIYEAIVRGRRDPALLEYIGRNAFQASVFPIPARGEKRIEIEYQQVLTLDQGLARYVYPLGIERLSPTPLANLSLEVTIKADQEIKAVYSPTHEIDVDRVSDHEVVVGYEASDVRPVGDFALYYSVAGGEMGLSLLTYRQRHEDGYFLMLVTPQAEVPSQAVVAKDVTVVLDVSGSMQGEKIRQAVNAARYIIDHLNPDDRFNIITFSSGVNTFADEPQPLAAREEARRFLDQVRAVGGTNIEGALREALGADHGGRPHIVFFLTDGQPTVGEQEPEAIIEDALRTAARDDRLFAFGVGDDVNTILLDGLASKIRGTSAYVRPNEDIEASVSMLYDRVSVPVLADVKLEVDGVTINDLYPQELPDLFLGSQLSIVGRYRGDGAATVSLSGTVNGEPRRYTFEQIEFPARRGRDSFLPRLWAQRKIGALLAEIRLHGPRQELIDEVVQLSTRYGIITPYTSFLVQEPGQPVAEGPRGTPMPVLAAPTAAAAQARQQAAASRAAPAGAAAVEEAEKVQSLAGAEVAADTGVETVRVVGEKSFFLRGDVWVDSQFQGGETVKLSFGSANYFDFLAARPEWAKFFALGPRVVVVLDGVAYESIEGEAPPIAIPTPVAE